jgi:uncharacterized protein (DUF4213/DUF364 family)
LNFLNNRINLSEIESIFSNSSQNFSLNAAKLTSEINHITSRGEKNMLTIQKRLIDVLQPQAERSTISDVRIGLGYTAVKLDTGHAGVAWTPRSSASGCTHLKTAGTLAGSPVREILRMLTDETSALGRALGLATANALLAALPQQPTIQEEVIASLGITSADRVAMVGYFAPVIGKLKKTKCRLDIIEMNPHLGTNTLSPGQGQEALAACTVAVITGTTLINATFDEVSAALGNPRAAVVLGPSSPLCGDVFNGTKITHIAGSRVTDPDGVLRIVSEGGGTMLMKPHLEFQTVLTRTQMD